MIRPDKIHSAEDTGRLAGTLAPRARAIVFGDNADRQIDADLALITEVDRAHLVMLREAGILPAGPVAALLRGISDLRADGFRALRGRPAPRGLYLLYETHLIHTLGADVGGILQTGRSRNDLGATVLRMRLREMAAGTLRVLLRLQGTLLRRSATYADAVLPIHTHYQAAQPITLGHYYAGVAGALGRDAGALLSVLDDLSVSPLGAGAVAGTSLPINPARTAALLGFSGTFGNSIDAIASRDVVLRLLSALTVLGTTLSRLGHDLQLWTAAEFGFLLVPDTLVGSSSMMPQKRNVYLLEHVKGLAIAPLGAFAASAGAMHAAPFTNSIAVGTEAVRPVWDAAGQIGNAMTLLRLIVEDAVPDRAAMRGRAVDGFTAATALADWLVHEAGMPFRAAHHAVGSLVRGAVTEGVDLAAAARAGFPEWFERSPPPRLAPEEIVAAAGYGGGPAPGTVARDRLEQRGALLARIRRMRAWRARWLASGRLLEARVRDLAGLPDADFPGSLKPTGTDHSK